MKQFDLVSLIYKNFGICSPTGKYKNSKEAKKGEKICKKKIFFPRFPSQFSHTHNSLHLSTQICENQSIYLRIQVVS